MGEWVVGLPPDGTPWRSDVFKDLAHKLLTSVVERGFRDPASLWHRTRGFSGEVPSEHARVAIQAAVRFAALDANDFYRMTDLNRGSFITTSENSTLFLQPIDEAEKRITHLEGGALRMVLLGGIQIGAVPLPLPDAVVSVTRPVRASKSVARAMFASVRRPQVKKNRRLALAAQWHAVAMANASAVTNEQRIIALKTGFEALFGTSSSRECARLLRHCFESVCAPHVPKLPWSGVLWSPKERIDLQRVHKKNGVNCQDTRSELEDFFMALANARNAAIHEGALPTIEYTAPPERPLSRYAGNLFWIGERLLREAIKAKLGVDVLLCGLIKRWKALEPIAEQLRVALANEPQTDDESATEETPPIPPRSIDVLLAALAAAANTVVLSKAIGSGSASLEVAQANARAMQDMWQAAAGGRELLITSAERDLLRAHGAEDKLHDYFDECD
jgi:hypothetical protein